MLLRYEAKLLSHPACGRRRQVWDLETLECSKVLEGHLEAVLALAVGNGHLISGSYDTTVRRLPLQWQCSCLRRHLSQVQEQACVIQPP